MLWFGRLRRRLSVLLRREEVQREMDDEMRHHLEMEADKLVRIHGLSPEEARRRARIAFGGVERFKEEGRDARGVRWLEDLLQDLRFGLRVLARRPAFSFVAILTLAIGISATTSVFGLANATLFRPAPAVHDPDRLIQVRFRAPHLEDEETGLSYPNLMDLRSAELPSLTHLAGWQDNMFQVAVPGEATALLTGAAVVGDYFGMLGVRPAAGRLLSATETEIGAAEPVVVLSERARQTLFGEAAAAVGRTLSINGIPFVVIGITGDGFRGATRGGDSDLWIPFGLYPRVRHMKEGIWIEREPSHLHDVIGRLADGATPVAAQAQLREAMDRLVAAYPAANERMADYRPSAFTELGITPWALERTRKTITLLLAAVGLVLLVACANVANLLIFRGVRRQGESAVRQAMGASQSRLLRQLLAESGLLAAGGVVVGLGGTLGLIQLFRGVRLPGLPPLDSLPLDSRVLAFAAMAGAATVLLAGLLPAVVVHRIDLVRSLKDAAPTETGHKLRLRAGLTIAQLALSLGLVVGASLLLRTLQNLHGVRLGFDPEAVVEVRVNPEPQGYDEERANRFQREILRAVADVPGTEAVGAAASGPLRAVMGVDLRGGDAAPDGWPVEAYGDYVSPDYFAALGVPLRRGRSFSMAELEASWQQTSDVAIVNETLARRLFGTEDAALGRTIVQRGYRENTTLEVIGVVADSRVRDLEGPQEPVLYRPLGEHYSNGLTLVVRSTRPPELTIGAVRAAVDRLDSRLPFYWAGSLSQRVRELTAEQRLLAQLMTVLAALAALLAGVGLYGVVAYSVTERTREIGIRMALGAGRSEVVALVLRQSLVLALAGVLIGAGAAWAFGRFLESRLFGIAALDPATWLTAAATLLILALVAAAAPARAAVKIDPVRALKT